MNVRQLGTGSINTGYFFLAAALIGGCAALLSFIVKPLERQLQHRREEIADDLDEDVAIIQKREILRQSKLGKRLWERKDNVELGWQDQTSQGLEALSEHSLEEADDQA